MKGQKTSEQVRLTGEEIIKKKLDEANAYLRTVDLSTLYEITSRKADKIRE